MKQLHSRPLFFSAIIFLEHWKQNKQKEKKKGGGGGQGRKLPSDNNHLLS